MGLMKTPALALLAGFALVGCQPQETAAPAMVIPVQRKLAVGATPESVTKGFDGKYFVTLMGTSRKLGDADGKIAQVDGDKVTVLTEGLDDPKGIVFVGDNFVLGLLGKPTLLDVSKVEALCKEHSTKEVKARTQDQVKFDYKEKGKKPVVTKGICQFAITGQDFKIEKIAELLKASGANEIE
jgi:hypothetical protein